MIAAFDANSTVVTVDHTRRWQLPFIAAQKAIDEGVIGKVKRITATGGGGRAMVFRNGTHLIDGVIHFSDSDPEWVFAELEDGFDAYAAYSGDGGRDPSTDPACSGFIHFKNGIRAYINFTKEMMFGYYLQVIGETGLLDIYEEDVILRSELNSNELLLLPPYRIYGIAACIEDLIRAMETGTKPDSTPRQAKKVVEVIVGFLQSHTRGNVRVDLPLPPGH